MLNGQDKNFALTHEDMRRITVEDRDIRSDIDMAVANSVNAIIAAAIRFGASDIHFEPMDKKFQVRIRVDGELHQLLELQPESEQPMMARIKVMCKMRMDDQRILQDGRISLSYKDEPFSRRYNIRVSVVPKQLLDRPAEKAVFRILGSTMAPDVEQLGLSAQARTHIETVMSQPHGMFILTGPTGSGKTTTLNAMLKRLNSMSVNILTIEDPIEYHIPGITQVQTNEPVGITFSSALRSFLRQDPDIIMVGEIRDVETAQMAVRAALTGHLVLSTLHTNDAPSSLPRLIDLGVEQYLLPSALMGIMAQRLVKCLCPDCKEAYEGSALELACLGYKPEDPNQKLKLFRPKGCPNCMRSGYRGRRGIYEVMMINEKMRDMLLNKKDLSYTEVRQSARDAGMRELREEGIDLVLNGVTTVEQVKKVVYTVDAA
jgi:type II secretory ATPase GspE/PulE/Tfp pilus assembly ATPase PilB-like protein